MAKDSKYFQQSQSPLEYVLQNFNGKMRSVNGNVLNDEKDLEVGNRITQNFGLPEKIPVYNDLISGKTLTPNGQELITRTFTGFTL